jgi:hypothetical protein
MGDGSRTMAFPFPSPAGVLTWGCCLTDGSVAHSRVRRQPIHKHRQCPSGRRQSMSMGRVTYRANYSTEPQPSHFSSRGSRIPLDVQRQKAHSARVNANIVVEV